MSKFDKKKTVTFSVLHRSHEDPLYYDNDVPESVLVLQDKEASKQLKKEQREVKKNKKKNNPSNKRGKMIVFDENFNDEEFKKEGRRENEGEAAIYGIQFDDSKYDYMQHLKPIGESEDAVFIAKKDEKSSSGRKGKDSAFLLKSEYREKNDIRLKLPQELFPSAETVPRDFEKERNVPEAISGFQPDMDPDLREVLEALEDEEYVTDPDDDENDELFNQLIASGQAEEEEDEYDDYDDYDYENYEDDAYGSDDGNDFGKAERFNDEPESTPMTLKEINMKKKGAIEGLEKRVELPQFEGVSEEQAKSSGFPSLEDSSIPEVHDLEENDSVSQDWTQEFEKYKSDKSRSRFKAQPLDSEAGDGVGPLSVVTSATRKTNKQRRRRNNRVMDLIGGLENTHLDGKAMTEHTGLSLSSSAVYRNRHLTLLDERFDTVEKEYLEDTASSQINDESVIVHGNVPKSAGINGNYDEDRAFDMAKERSDFDSILDDFLAKNSGKGKKKR